MSKTPPPPPPPSHFCPSFRSYPQQKKNHMLGSMEINPSKSPPHKTAHETAHKKPYKKPYKNPLAPNQHPLFLTYSLFPIPASPVPHPSSLIPKPTHIPPLPTPPLSLNPPASLSPRQPSPILQFSNSPPPLRSTIISKVSRPFSYKKMRKRKVQKSWGKKRAV